MLLDFIHPQILFRALIKCGLLLAVKNIFEVKMQYVKKIFNEKTCLILLAFTTLLILAIYAYKKSLYFTSIPIDGAFQHLNPMRRIAEGELPGRDFNIFHGLIVSYLHYPIYKLFGGDLFSSELSRYILNGISAYVVILSIFITLERFKVAMILTISTVFVAQFYSLFILIDPVGNAYSSLAVRTLLPGVIVAYLLHANNKGFFERKSMLTLYLPIGLFSAIAMAIATEQGVAILIACLFGLLILNIGRATLLKRLLNISIFIIAFTFSYLLLVTIASGGAYSDALSFTWNDLPADQFWYFGTYPNVFPKNTLDFILTPGKGKIKDVVFIAIIAFISLIARWFSTTDLHKKRENEILFIGMVYGSILLISNFGMISDHYAEALVRLSLIVLFISMLSLMRKLIDLNEWVKPVGWTLLALLIFFPWQPKGLLYGVIELSSLNKNHKKNIRHAGVLPVGHEYIGLTKTSAQVLPPATFFRSPEKLSDDKSNGYLMILHENAESLEMYKEGNKIYINDLPETILQVSEDHLLTSSQVSASNYTVRYANLGKDFSRSSTPYYSNLWFNGIYALGDDGGCLMVPRVRHISKVRMYQTITFFGEEERQVTSIYRNVLCVNGPKLNPYIHGYPASFKVGKEISFASGDLSRTKNQAEAAFNDNGDLKNIYGVAGARSIFNDDGELQNIYGLAGESSVDIGKSVSMKNYGEVVDNKFQNQNKIKVERWRNKPCMAGDEPKLWSTYTGLIDLKVGQTNPAKVDYIIHALGKDNRKNYLDAFKETKPVFVHTIRPKYTAYERWIQVTSWGFYSALIENYEIVARTNYSFIWRRKSQNMEPEWYINPNAICQSEQYSWSDTVDIWDGDILVDESLEEVDISSIIDAKGKDFQVVILEVTYKLDNKFSHIPLLGESARHSLKPDDTLTPMPIPLSPYENVVTFPLLLKKNSNPRLILDSSSLLKGASIAVSHIRFRREDEKIAEYIPILIDN